MAAEGVLLLLVAAAAAEGGLLLRVGVEHGALLLERGGLEAGLLEGGAHAAHLLLHLLLRKARQLLLSLPLYCRVLLSVGKAHRCSSLLVKVNLLAVVSEVLKIVFGRVLAPKTLVFNICNL